jgi:hypothetical protein
MKKFFLIMAVAFSASMAVVIGFRLSADAMAVIIGIVCGVLASIPTSVVLVWVLRQRDKQLEMQNGSMRMGQYPPVVVVNGHGTSANRGMMAPTPLLASGANGTRDFKVIGQEGTESSGDILPPLWDQL